MKKILLFLLILTACKPIHLVIDQPTVNRSIGWQNMYSKYDFKDSTEFVKSPEFEGGVRIGNDISGSNIVEIDSVTTDGTNIYFYMGPTILTAVPGAGSAAWGSISGTLTNQVDLTTALGLKANANNAGFTGTTTGITAAMTGAMSTSHAANAITGTNITNWNTAYSWGDPSGLYAALVHTHVQTSIVGLPDSLLARYTKAQANTLLNLKANTTALAGYVPTSRTINGHPLSANVSVTAADVNLGNATNESKATMFTNPDFTGTRARLNTDTLATRAYARASGGGTGMDYPDAGIALSTGSDWGTSITNNSANWNTSYGWGNHLWGTISGTLTNQIDLVNALNLKANLASPTFTGTVNGITAAMVAAMSTAHAANAITGTNISNWNTAYSWGNHSGIYAPLSHTQAQSTVTGLSDSLLARYTKTQVNTRLNLKANAADYVPITRTVNGHALNANILVTAADASAVAIADSAAMLDTYSKIPRKTQYLIGTGTAPVSGDSILTNTSYISKTIDVWREGNYQYQNTVNTTDGFKFDSATGQLIFRPVFGIGEQIIIKYY